MDTQDPISVPLSAFFMGLANKTAPVATNTVQVPNGGVGQGGGAFPHENLNGVQSYVKQLSDQTFGPGEWPALYGLLSRESGFNPTAQNPTSTASGLFQMINSTAAAHGLQGSAKDSPLDAQIKAGFDYIQKRYGTPSAALDFWQNKAPTVWGSHGY